MNLSEVKQDLEDTKHLRDTNQQRELDEDKIIETIEGLVNLVETKNRRINEIYDEIDKLTKLVEQKNQIIAEIKKPSRGGD